MKEKIDAETDRLRRAANEFLSKLDPARKAEVDRLCKEMGRLSLEAKAWRWDSIIVNDVLCAIVGNPKGETHCMLDNLFEHIMQHLWQ